MPAYVIVEVEVLDPAAFERYKPLAPPAIAAYGGRYVARGGRTETLEGDWSPSRLVILEFPSLERAREWWSSDEYTKAREARRGAANVRMVCVEGV
ncbi:MAG: DUF1330 domain-containing protein [Acidobacteriota bacterium]